MARKVDIPEREDEMRQKEEGEASFLLVAPTMDDLPVRSYHPGRLLTFFANAFPAGATFTLVSGPGTVDQTTGQYSWNPPLNQTAAVTVVIQASNGAGSTQKSTTLNRANQPPVIDFIADHTAHPGRQFSLFINAIDPDGDPVTLSVVGGPGGMNGALFTWIPPLNQTGSVPVTIQATDAPGDSVQQQFNINLANQAPFVDSIPDRNATVGNLLQFRVNGFDPDNDPVQYRLVGMYPAGAQLTAAGVFTWTPAAGQTGTWPFTVQATDACGVTCQRQFNVIVS